jgi:hypothetical protein
MRQGNAALREESEWIERAKPHGTRDPFYCDIGLTQPHADPAAEVPRYRKVGIEL